MSALSFIREKAQRLRHLPLLRNMDGMWNALRPIYMGALRLMAMQRGIEMTVGGHRLELHPRFSTAGWEAIEPDSYRQFAALLRPGDVVYDIGAHIGTYTLIALERIGPAGRVVAYEPHDVTRRYLQTHLRWADAGRRVIVRDVCCGLESGSTRFYFEPGDDCPGGSNGRVASDGFLEKTVSMVTLDEEVRHLGLVPTVIKMDIEGGEWDALRGAQRTLEIYHPRLLLSLHPKALERLGVDPLLVPAWLTARGYVTRVIARDHEIHFLAEPSPSILKTGTE